MCCAVTPDLFLVDSCNFIAYVSTMLGTGMEALSRAFEKGDAGTEAGMTIKMRLDPSLQTFGSSFRMTQER